MQNNIHSHAKLAIIKDNKLPEWHLISPDIDPIENSSIIYMRMENNIKAKNISGKQSKLLPSRIKGETVAKLAKPRNL